MQDRGVNTWFQIAVYQKEEELNEVMCARDMTRVEAEAFFQQCRHNWQAMHHGYRLVATYTAAKDKFEAQQYN